MTDTPSPTPTPTPPPLKLAVRANDAVRFEIVHEDADLIIVNKPAGLVTQPGKGHTTDSLLNGLFARHGKLLTNLGVRRDWGLLHRLDKDTSGLLVIAKMPSAYDQLRRDFEERRIEKEYLAIVRGIPKPQQGVVQARLKEVTVPGEEYGSVKKVVISRQGQDALSAYNTLSRVESPPAAQPAALLRVSLKTGRLHQIRAHMMFLGTPVFGDDLYLVATAGMNKNAKIPQPPRLCLHACRLGFKHPTTGKWVHYAVPLPGDLSAFAKRLGLTVPA